MNTRCPALPLLLLVPLLGGCFLSRRTVNGPIDPGKLAELTPGRTTAAEVVERLGAPSEVVQLHKRSAYRYEGSVSKDAGLWLLVVAFYNTDAHADRVWVFFDEHDVLTHVGSTLALADATYAMPWQETTGR